MGSYSHFLGLRSLVDLLSAGLDVVVSSTSDGLEGGGIEVVAGGGNCVVGRVRLVMGGVTLVVGGVGLVVGGAVGVGGTECELSWG